MSLEFTFIFTLERKVVSSAMFYAIYASKNVAYSEIFVVIYVNLRLGYYFINYPVPEEIRIVLNPEFIPECMCHY